MEINSTEKLTADSLQRTADSAPFIIKPHRELKNLMTKSVAGGQLWAVNCKL